ncbi:hypothetical protein [Streptomyces sp. NPDC089799]|uniref:hypothetical protein n=1 Tax=Streptomyces sp. NPDC089799 TaxID=3155066 RepID=UPI00342173AA
MRKRLSLLAAAGLIGAGAAVPAGAAGANGATGYDYRLYTPYEELFLSPYKEAGNATPMRVDFAVSGDSARPPVDAAYRVDLSGIKGIADVALPDVPANKGCLLGGAAVVCVKKGASDQDVVSLDVTAAKGTRGDESGKITVTGRAANGTFTSGTTTVTVNGTDLALEKLPLKADPAVGERQRLRPVIRNAGTVPLKAIEFGIYTSHGMTLEGDYGNCRDEKWRVVCQVEGDFLPGTTYEVSPTTPLGLTANSGAFREDLFYQVGHNLEYRIPQRPKPKLELVPRPAPNALRTPDLTPGDNHHRERFTVANSADLAVRDTAVTGRPGRTVKVPLGFRNYGPGWMENPYDSNVDSRAFPGAFFDVRLPEGVSAAEAPDACRPVDEKGAELPRTSPARRYICESGQRLFWERKIDFPFELKIDEVVEGAKGSLTVGWNTWGGGAPATEVKPANNTAALTVDAVTTSPSPTTSTSPSASTGPTPTATPTGSGTPSPTSSASGSATPTPDATGDTGTPAPDGQLGNTGSSALLLGGAAAAVIAAGAALVLAVRRRTGRA